MLDLFWFRFCSPFFLLEVNQHRKQILPFHCPTTLAKFVVSPLPNLYRSCFYCKSLAMTTAVGRVSERLLSHQYKSVPFRDLTFTDCKQQLLLTRASLRTLEDNFTVHSQVSYLSAFPSLASRTACWVPLGSLGYSDCPGPHVYPHQAEE